jgi:hypothetical protein
MTSLKQSNQETQWYLYYDGKQSGPMGRSTLISTMRTITQLKDARVWNAQLTDWKSLFDVPELLSEIGVLTRHYVRADIVGDVEVMTSTGRQMNYPLSTISEGGFGVPSAPELRLGERIQFTIRSPLLVSQIRAIGRVVSQAPNASVGFTFEALNMESKSIILDYVNQQNGHIIPDDGASARAMFATEPVEETNGSDAHIKIPVQAQFGWHINRMGVEQGPMSKDELLSILTQLDDKSMVRISNDKKEWRGPFDFEEVVSALNISRRQYNRAPIVGEIMLQSEDRGAGVRGDMPFLPGQSFQALLNCPVLKTTIEVEVECIHTQSHRVCGIKFVSFEKHHRAEIKTYVSLFVKPGTELQLGGKQTAA